MVDIFDEVNEDLRAERVSQLLKRHSGKLLAICLFIVAGAGGWQAWKWWQGRQDGEAAALYGSAMFAVDESRSSNAASAASAAARFEQAAVPPSNGYRVLSDLRAAQLKMQANDPGSAEAMWDRVARNASLTPPLRDVANLAWVRAQLDAGDPATLGPRLLPLTAVQSEWHGLALEAQGLLELRAGQANEAKEVFRRLAADPDVPDGVRGRANVLLSRLGG